MTSFADDFNRADSSTVGNGWVEVSGDWAIISNQLAPGSGGGTVICRCGTDMTTPDHAVQATLSATAAVSAGIWARGNSNISSGYLFRNDGSSWNLFSVVGGSFTSIGSYAAAAVNGDVARLECVGSAIKAYVNGVLRVDVTDTAVTTGTSTGFRAEASAAVRFDSFSAADVGATVVEGAAAGVAGGASGAASATRVVDSALAGVAGGAAGSVAATAVVEASVSGSAGGASGMASGTSVVVAAAGGFAGGASGAVTATREVLASLSGTAFGANGHITAEGGTGGGLHPSNTQVAIAWLRQVLGLPAAATLPAVEGWFDTGFVTVPAIAGGNPNPYVPERRPIMQIDTWAANRASATAGSVSRKIPLSKANQLADQIVLATYEHQAGTLITLPSGFKDVWIMEVYPVSEVRRIPEPKSSYAHFSVDIALMWIERDPVI